MMGGTATARLVLHIGDPKTGSSSIQRVLFGKGWQCDTRRLDYPDNLNAYSLANALGPSSNQGQAETRFKPYSDWLAQSQADVAEISGKTFSMLDPKLVAAAVDRYFPNHGAGMQVVAHARPHVSRIMSAYGHRTKAGRIQRSLKAFLAAARPKKRMTFHDRFDMWRKVFGDRFVLRPMERQALRDGDVVADFLGIALDGAPFRLLTPTHVNNSMSIEALAGLRIAHGVLEKFALGGNSQHTIGARISELVAEAGGAGTKLRLSQAMYDKIYKVCIGDAEVLDRNFFGIPVMTEALQNAGSETLAMAQDWSAESFYPEEVLKDLRKNARRLGRIFQAHPGIWETAHRREKGFKSIFDEPEPDSADTIDVISQIDAILAEIVALLVVNPGLPGP